jgi:dCMP deaminase
MTRPSWDEYFLKIVDTVSERSTCDRGKAGALIVKDRRILSTGYAGSPPGQPHCDEAGHMLRRVVDEDDNITQHCVRTIHAEANALIQAAKFGIPVEGATLYSKFEPCYSCAMLTVGAGIKRVVARKKYHAAEESRKLLKNADVELVVFEDSVIEYENQ